MSTASENLNSLNTTSSYNYFQVQMTDSDSKEKIKIKTKKVFKELLCTDDIYIYK